MQNEDGNQSEKVDPQKVWDGLSAKSHEEPASSRGYIVHSWFVEYQPTLNIMIFIIIIFGFGIIGNGMGHALHWLPPIGTICGVIFGCIIGLIYFGISAPLIEINKNLHRIADEAEKASK